MSRIKQNSDSHGSLKDIQLLINDYPNLINSQLSDLIECDKNIKWKSPLSQDDYAEYRDNSFLHILSLPNELRIPLSNFWPKMGPQWDSLGISNKGIILVEAKANLSEIESPPCGAKDHDSIHLISESLNKTQKHLGIDTKTNWMNTYYQYANRIAHLYYLNVINKIPTYLVFIYFINDKSVKGPKSEDEWRKPIQKLKTTLGIPEHHSLNDRILELFVDVNDFEQT